MRTLRNNILAVAVVAALGTGTVFAGGDNNKVKTKKTSTTAYNKDKANIGKTAKNISYHEAKVEALEAELKANKKSGNEAAVINTRQELRKAKADLEHQRAYLKADEKALKARHCAAIKEDKRELKEDRAELRKTKRQLRKDIRQENEAAVVAGAASFAALSKQVEKSEMALHHQRESMKTDLAWVDEVTDEKADKNQRVAIRQSNGNLDEKQADMAYEGARWLIVTDYN